MESKNSSPYAACKLKADILFIHAPAYFDFRNESRVYFPYLSTTGVVPNTPLYEHYPMGFNTLRRFLTEKGYDTEIINLSSLLLKYPKLNIEELLKQIEVRIIGIDLHWLVHVQGSLEVASLLKKIHPHVKIIFGGISATFYADELITYPFIDMVMRGYDTHIPMAKLMDAETKGGNLNSIPNLLWKEQSGQIKDNSFSYLPSSFSIGMDWENIPSLGKGELFPIAELLALQTTGCTHNCLFCGGSRESFKRINGTKHIVARKDLEDFSYEFETMKKLPNLEKYHFYTLSSYCEPESRLEYLFDLISQSNFMSVNYEQFSLTNDSLLKKMAQAHSETIITLSPESHDLEISKLAGRGTYTMDEMEAWISKALDYGIYEISIWFFIGMPKQDKKSVYDTVRYCEKLLNKFQGNNVIPFICPLVPILDPGSTFFLEPEQHGYKLFYRTLEEHRQGMKRASFINRINYETKWLSREEIVYTGYEAIRELFQMKGQTSLMPSSLFRSAVNKIDDACQFLKVVHQIDCIEDQMEREKELENIADEIKKRNDSIFLHGVDSQAFPINRKIGGRWFDNIPWDAETLEKLEDCPEG